MRHTVASCVRRGAKFLLRLLESLGADVKMARCSEEQNPLVLARLGHDPARPTVTFYGHYDVQPASEPEWRTNPFELVAVDGHLYGRWAGCSAMVQADVCVCGGACGGGEEVANKMSWVHVTY